MLRLLFRVIIPDGTITVSVPNLLICDESLLHPQQTGWQRWDEKKAGGHLLKGRNFDDPGSSGSTTLTRQAAKAPQRASRRSGIGRRGNVSGRQAIARSWYRVWYGSPAGWAHKQSTEEYGVVEVYKLGPSARRLTPAPGGYRHRRCRLPPEYHNHAVPGPQQKPRRQNGHQALVQSCAGSVDAFRARVQAPDKLHSAP
ncbi:hypothetical protein HPB52_021705 [Rhipicephalus sanguineus]|uniref:Uncharacterized protein n=1 Tax=Rhipicephalus sanguineus TaxID=34632 RepID=A0A9D4T4F4_RHISA|nr:hypothetical protein HPB52_021705 [Rhipicephalus sanguineus]